MNVVPPHSVTAGWLKSAGVLLFGVLLAMALAAAIMLPPK
jgi:hypothetical protein